jgi:hypothetical protein
MFLSIQYVLPILLNGAPGGWAAIKLGAPTPACGPEAYYALLPKADRYTGQVFFDMWNEIAAGGLSNTMQSGCSFEGIATQWAARTVGSGATLTLSPSAPVQFIRAGPFQAPSVPALSWKGVAMLALGLAAVALVLLLRSRA